MYALMSDGQVVGLAEEPNYVEYRKVINAYVHTDKKEEADGIEFQGKLFNFDGKNNIEGAPQVEIYKQDGMNIVFNQQMRISKNEGSTLTLEEAVTEMDTVNDERFTVIEDALVELDGLLNPGA